VSQFNFLSHRSSVATIVPLVVSHPNPVSLPFNLFQTIQSFFNASHLFLNLLYFHDLSVLFLNAASMFLQPIFVKWVFGRLPKHLIHTYFTKYCSKLDCPKSSRIWVTLFWFRLGLEIIFLLSIYKIIILKSGSNTNI
jgi:hypothetical protein